MTTENNLQFKGLSSEEVRLKQKSGESNKTTEKEVKPFSEILLENGFSIFNLINLLIIGILLFFGFRNGDSRLFLDSIGIFTITFSTLDTICLDKTGTITNSNIKISQIIKTTGKESNGDIKKLLGTYAQLISDEDNVIKTLKELENFENAVKNQELPFRSEIKMSFLQFEAGNEQYTLVLGAYENVLKNLTFDKRKIVRDIYKNSNCTGYRNLLFGKINIQRNEKLENYRNYIIHPLCIVSFSEEIKSGINEIFNLFKEKNIEVKILSGDSGTSFIAARNNNITKPKNFFSLIGSIKNFV